MVLKSVASIQFRPFSFKINFYGKNAIQTCGGRQSIIILPPSIAITKRSDTTFNSLEEECSAYEIHVTNTAAVQIKHA
jgi:hypothetical protein